MALLSWRGQAFVVPRQDELPRAAAAADGHDREADTEEETHLTGRQRARRGGAATLRGLLLLLPGRRGVQVLLVVLAAGVVVFGRTLIGELLFLAGDRDQLQQLLQAGYVPVLPPMALSDDGLLNIDGDRASAAVAGALHASALVILSNVRGLYRNFPDETSFVQQVPAHQMTAALGWAQGRMKRKVLGAQEALDGGVERVIISDGRVHHPVQQALAGQGTVFIR
jgi:hypothetical protein